MRGVADENGFLRSTPPDRYYGLRFHIEKIVEISIKPIYKTYMLYISIPLPHLFGVYPFSSEPVE